MVNDETGEEILEVDGLKEQYQTNLMLFEFLQDKFENEYNFEPGEWMNDIVFVAQLFLDTGQEMTDYMFKQEVMINMYQKKYGPLKGDKLAISVHAQSVGDERPKLVSSGKAN